MRRVIDFQPFRARSLQAEQTQQSIDSWLLGKGSTVGLDVRHRNFAFISRGIVDSPVDVCVDALRKGQPSWGLSWEGGKCKSMNSGCML